MWASTLLGPYVSDPMHLKLSKSYMGIFVGVNYEGVKGWKYCWSQRIGRAREEEIHACRFFPHRVEWWDCRREKESQAGVQISRCTKLLHAMIMAIMVVS